MELHPTIRKILASSVMHGEYISRNGAWLWGAFDGERLVAWAATVPEAKQNYRRAWRREIAARAAEQRVKG
jgi:hypothetical protein